MKAFLLIFLMLFLASCASTSKIAALQANAATYKCSGILSWVNCQQQAAAVCGNGFVMLQEYENITIQRRELTVACKS